MTKNKKAEEIAFSRCDVPERTKRFALKYVSEAYAGIKNCKECEFYNTCDRIDSVRAELRKKKKEGMKNMTEQETRGKIFNIIREFNVKKRRYSTHTEPSDDDELADALIAAGIGEVKEAEHRAARAERALYKACKDIKDICEYLVKVGGTGVITIESYSPEQSEPSAYIDRAEKELAEGRKDD